MDTRVWQSCEAVLLPIDPIRVGRFRIYVIEDDARAQRGWWFVAISLLQERPSVY